MLGIIYLLLAVLLGREIIEKFLNWKEMHTDGMYNRLWVVLPASFGVGVLAVTWLTYLVSWAAAVGMKAKAPLFYGNLIVMAVTAVFLGLLYILRRRKGGRVSGPEQLVSNPSLLKKEIVFFAGLLLFFTWICFYVFYIKDGILYSGFTVFSDYAPHTAMIRSFSRGANFPTQYPHFGGQDVKYHFMFQFLAGNLEYLGLRIDVAYNLISILSLEGFLMLLYELAGRLTGGFACGVLSVIFFFFRSAFTFFRFLWEHVQAGDLLQVLRENTAFIGYTTNESWGLWNFNVYLNQRHLAFGLLLVCLILWIFVEWMQAGAIHEEKGFAWIKKRFFTKEAWKSRSLETAIFAGMILGLCAFWNGAAVIGGLLVLMGFAVFSDGKLDYAAMAGVTILFSVLQTKIFIRGDGLGISFYWGFLAEEKTIAGVGKYLLSMSGIFFVGLVVLVFFFKRVQRMALFGFLFPAVFAFMASLTPDISVNHKYIMISYALLTMFWADAVVRLWRRRHILRMAAAVLAVCLTVTGIYDFVVILKDNGAGHRAKVNMNGALTGWLADNLDQEDLILTPEYSMNEVTMAGVMLYCGWPYYAWSAGYDTSYRAGQAVKIYTSADPQEVKQIVSSEGITYILFEEGMEFEERTCREDVIAGIYPLAYQSEDGRIRIYEA